MEGFRGATLAVGTDFAGYRVEGLLGRGGMGVVYRTRDLALGRIVALKLLVPELATDEHFRERFHREARLAASIDHPNVVPIYQVGEGRGLLYIAMRYVEGTDLASLLRAEGPLEARRALALASQVAAGLDAAHRRGLIHRDVKPSNVLIATEGEREHCYLADFGLTKSAESPGDLASGGRLLGTPDYLAPEQIVEGASGPASDLYSLGCVLFECLTGKVPFSRGSEFAGLWAHVHDPPPKASALRPALPEALDRVFETALAKDPTERYGSGAELVDAARAAFPPEQLAPVAPSRRRQALVGAVAALVVAAAAVAGAILLTREDAGSATKPTLALRAGALQRIDARTNKLVATIHIGGRPVDVAVGRGNAWVVDPVRRAVVRIDPATNTARRGASGLGDPAAVTVGRSGVFVAGDGPEGATVARIDPKRLDPTDEAPLRSVKVASGGLPVRPVSAVAGLAVAERVRGATIWVADTGAGLVWRGDAGPTGRTVRGVATGGHPLAVARRDGDLWVAQTQPDTVVRVHERGGRESRASARVAGTPVAVAPAQDGVWIADDESDAVSLVDPQGRIVRRARVGGHPIDLALGEGAVWVLRRDGVLARVDPASGRIVARIRVGGNPTALAVGDGAVWVAMWGGTPLELGRLPRRYRDVGGRGVEGIEPGRPGERCRGGSPARDCVVIVSREFAADDGTHAFRRSALREMRTSAGSVECLGRIYDGPAISDVKGDAGFARVEIEGWGTIALRLKRYVAAFSGTDVGESRICGEETGAWTGTSGALRGARGTFMIQTPPEPRQPIRLTLRTT